MQIHRVKKGESVYSISREYGVSPRKIIEINNLKNPDKLAVGRELLILFPRRTYTARRGDSVESISRRFSLDKSKIYKCNPTLAGTDKIYPEEILSLGYSDIGGGSVLIDGYIFKGCTTERLAYTLPYLSSITLASYVYENGRVRRTLPLRPPAHEKRKISERIYCPKGCAFSDTTADAFLSVTGECNSDGITLAIPKDTDGTEGFIEALKGKAVEKGISLTLECTEDISEPLASFPDRLVVNDGCDGDIFSSFFKKGVSHKTYMDISPFATVNGSPVPIDDALALADESGITLEQSGGDLIGKTGKGEIIVPSLKRIKAKLDLIGELGLLGAVIDVMRCPVSILMMLSSLYEINTPYSFGGM